MKQFCSVSSVNWRPVIQAPMQLRLLGSYYIFITAVSTIGHASVHALGFIMWRGIKAGQSSCLAS